MLSRRTRSHVGKSDDNDDEEDSDVAEERKRVEFGLRSDEQHQANDLIVVKGLSKIFAGVVPRKDVVAVDNVSVGIKSGEVNRIYRVLRLNLEENCHSFSRPLYKTRGKIRQKSCYFFLSFADMNYA